MQTHPPDQPHHHPEAPAPAVPLRDPRRWEPLLTFALLWSVFFFVRRPIGHELNRFLTSQLGSQNGWRPLLLGCGVLALSALIAVGVALALTRFPLGLKTARPVRKLLLGVVVGGVLVTLGCLHSLIGGSVYRDASTDGAHAPIVGLGLFLLLLVQSSMEELLLRGASQPLLSGVLGTRMAVLITAVLFAVLHARNPQVTWLAVANIALVGVFFGLMRVATGSLWVPMGIHTGWNWVEGYVWGAPVSGFKLEQALWRITPAPAAELWTGGPFGPEASLWTTLIFVLLGVLAWRRSFGQGKQEGYMWGTWAAK